MTDPIANMFVMIKNAQGIRAETVDVPFSKVKAEIVRILLTEGYIAKADRMKRMGKEFIRLFLKYQKNKKGVITGMKRVSKPGRRIYLGMRNLPRIQGGFGTALISTSKGIMTDEAARANKLGGEIIGYVW